MLKVENLKKYFGGVKAVNDCSFEIATGKITALIGPNGAGKSTVFNLISGILKSEEGKIIFDGVDITNKSIEDISNLGLSRLFQQSRVFKNLTVKENLLLAIDNKDMDFWKNTLGINKYGVEKEKRVKDILKRLNIAHIENHIAGELSFGQKRLVELARAVLNPHKLLILDEPAGGVTPQLRKKIAEVVLGLKKKGETVMFIEHDMNFTLGIADTVIVMDAGCVIAHGTPKEVKNNPKVLEAYLGE